MMKKGLWIALLIAPVVFAEPEIMADFGGTKTGFTSPSDRLRDLAKKQRPPAAIARQPMTNRLPMKSHMSVGIVEPHAHDMPVSRPFFIVGYDRHSAEWLEANRDFLIEINARGLVTNVKSTQQMNVLREYGGTLPLDAIPVDSIAKVFDLEFYPVLVTKEEVTQ
jgi:integrating conjugative element protein (TIGR03765 family)